MTDTAGKAEQWAGRLRAFLPAHMAADAALAPAAERATLILHGSTMLGVDDEWSDLDLWMLLDDADIARLDAASPTRFFEFKCGGKPGHMNACAAGAFRESIRCCDMDAICQLRSAAVIADGAGVAGELVALARRPMPEAVRRGLFMYHYVEMRGEHRALDNPIERRDAVAILLSLPKALAYALRAAMVLDGKPYPYDKWLHRAALETPTGRLVAPSVARMLDSLASGALFLGGPEREHPVSSELRVIRGILRDSANARGIDEPWLTQWWLHIDQARDTMAAARWG